MGKHGKSFISIDGGRHYLDDSAFEGAIEPYSSDNDVESGGFSVLRPEVALLSGNSGVLAARSNGAADEASNGSTSGGRHRRRRGVADTEASLGSIDEKNVRERLEDAKVAVATVSTAITALQSRLVDLKWKEKVGLKDIENIFSPVLLTLFPSFCHIMALIHLNRSNY